MLTPSQHSGEAITAPRRAPWATARRSGHVGNFSRQRLADVRFGPKAGTRHPRKAELPTVKLGTA
jgi:hypothetical protein